MIKKENIKTLYITRYALEKKGIYKSKLEQMPQYRENIYREIKLDDDYYDYGDKFLLGHYCFYLQTDAIKKAEKMRLNEIKRLNERIKELEGMKFQMEKE